MAAEAERVVERDDVAVGQRRGSPRHEVEVDLGVGVVRLIVGGRLTLVHGQDREDRLERRPRRPSRCPVIDFVALTRDVVGVRRRTAARIACLGDVADRGRRRVRVDVHDVPAVEPGALEACAHRARPRPRRSGSGAAMW